MSVIDRTATASAEAGHVWRNLAYLRNTFRLSDSEIARASDIRRGSVMNKLKGATPLTVEEALRLSKLFGVPLPVLQLAPQEAREWINLHWDEVEQSLRNRCSALGWAREGDWSPSH